MEKISKQLVQIHQDTGALRNYGKSQRNNRNNRNNNNHSYEHMGATRSNCRNRSAETPSAIPLSNNFSNNNNNNNHCIYGNSLSYRHPRKFCPTTISKTQWRHSKTNSINRQRATSYNKDYYCLLMNDIVLSKLDWVVLLLLLLLLVRCLVNVLVNVIKNSWEWEINNAKWMLFTDTRVSCLLIMFI